MPFVTYCDSSSWDGEAPLRPVTIALNLRAWRAGSYSRYHRVHTNSRSHHTFCLVVLGTLPGVKSPGVLNRSFASILINWYSGGLSPIGSTRHCGLLCQPRVIKMMEKLVEWWLGRETEVFGENLLQYLFVHHKPHMLPGREPGPPRWEASD
jgi:hypothetical protein